MGKFPKYKCYYDNNCALDIENILQLTAIIYWTINITCQMKDRRDECTLKGKGKGINLI